MPRTGTDLQSYPLVPLSAMKGRHFEECIDHGAFGDLIARTACGHVRHHTLQPPEVGNLLPNVFEMLHGQRMNFRARTGMAIDKTQ